MKAILLTAAAMALSGCLAGDLGMGGSQSDLAQPVANYTSFRDNGTMATNSDTHIWMRRNAPQLTATFAQEAYEMDLKDGQSVDERRMEIRSHEIQTVVAVERYLKAEDEYRAKMADWLKSGYPYFADLTAGDLVRKMEHQHKAAVKWVSKNNPVLDEFEAFAVSEGVVDEERAKAIEAGARP